MGCFFGIFKHNGEFYYRDFSNLDFEYAGYLKLKAALKQNPKGTPEEKAQIE